jgi:hypothetical protein
MPNYIATLEVSVNLNAPSEEEAIRTIEFIFNNTKGSRLLKVRLEKTSDKLNR